MALYGTRLLKRKLSTDSVAAPPYPHRQFKRSKSENVSIIKRFLIGCAHLIYVKADSRERDREENIIPLDVPPKKAYAPSSDLAQKEIVQLYFNDIDRTVVSQSKSKAHVFALPDWSVMEEYLFPWICYNMDNNLTPSRIHIKHIAFRIWEYLVQRGDTEVKSDDDEDNVPLGDVRGWWWEVDGDMPRMYEDWKANYNRSIPGTRHLP
jgi:hypothetical protein